MNPMVVVSNAVFWQQIFLNFLNFFEIFPGCFQKWFCLHKKVSLTTLAPSGTPSGATHGPSQAQGGLQNCLFCQISPI
jgi:hypothetical protein